MNSEIVECLKSIQSRLDNIESDLMVMKTTTQKMSDHINFVENTYRLVRAPLGYMIGCVKGAALEELPKLNNGKE